MRQAWQVRPAYVAGIGITAWGFYPDVESREYTAAAIRHALVDAGLGWDAVEAAFVGSCYQGVGSGHRVLREIGLPGFPIVNVENACASSTSALRLAFREVAAGMHDVVLVVGMEKNPRGPIPSSAFHALQSELGFNFQPANYALETVKYMERTGATIEDISLVTVKNRRNAALNPHARFRTPVSLEEVLQSRPIAPPLNLLHCCPLADGAAAAVVCSAERLADRRRGVRIAAATLCSGVYGDEYIPGGIVGSARFPTDTGMTRRSAREAFESGGVGPEDVDVVQAYDTVSASELWDLEELGFCEEGEAPRLLRQGVFDLGGRLPVNTDGGLMGRGHPMGATGLGQIVEVVSQLRGEAGTRQVPSARIGLAHAQGAGGNSAVVILIKD